MGQDDILDLIVTRRRVTGTELNSTFKQHGPISQQLKSLRNKGLADRRLENGQWIYYPTDEALRMRGIIDAE